MDKHGVAGLNILMALISMIFMIGIIVMVFVIAGSRLRTSIADTESSYVDNETVSTVNTATAVNLARQPLRDASCSVVYCYNASNSVAISSANYTVSGCGVKYTPTSAPHTFNKSNWNCTYTYTYTGNAEAQDVINETYKSIADTPDWFPTYIVLGSLVVLILLVVIIITSVRQTGFAGESGKMSDTA